MMDAGALPQHEVIQIACGRSGRAVIIVWQLQKRAEQAVLHTSLVKTCHVSIIGRG